MGSAMKWKQEIIEIDQGDRPPRIVDGRLSPSGRWHIRKAHPACWAITHVPTGLLAFSRDGTRRDAIAWLDALDAKLGPVTSAEHDRDAAHDLVSMALA